MRIEFQITGGEVHDCKIAPKLIDKLLISDYMIADKGYDSEEIRGIIRQKSSNPIIPRKTNSTIYVYILAGKRNGTLYVSSTRNLIERVWADKNKVLRGFTEKYNVNRLVYYEVHEMYIEAARREKRFKNWCRQWKLNLIEEFNPTWRALYQEIC